MSALPELHAKAMFGGFRQDAQDLQDAFSILSILFILSSVFIFVLMTLNEKTPGPDSSARRCARLRIIGVLVLLLGAGSAGIVYWMGTRSPDYSDDLSMVGYGRAESRQMGRLYGQSGLMVEDLFNNLKRPGIQATIIAAVSTLIASGCFFFARPPDPDAETH